jgi:hypothetical protein
MKLINFFLVEKLPRQKAKRQKIFNKIILNFAFYGLEKELEPELEPEPGKLCFLWSRNGAGTGTCQKSEPGPEP